MDSIGKRLRKTRRDQELSQPELARMSGLTYQAINRIELGHTMPRLDTVARLADSLKVDMKWLLFGDDDEGQGR